MTFGCELAINNHWVMTEPLNDIHPLFDSVAFFFLKTLQNVTYLNPLFSKSCNALRIATKSLTQ